MIRVLAEEIGVHKFTLIKWERGRMPRYKREIGRLNQAMPGVERFLATGK